MTIHLRNLVATADDLAARLWREAGRGGRDPRLRALAEDLATSTERLCRQAGGGPSDL
ncbi:MAG: hypothetical protein FJ098_13105, partial [Deltaproteobacteria bacterium]|nr:hypothetical protein [Deltaproteobacteria bacterium]